MFLIQMKCKCFYSNAVVLMQVQMQSRRRHCIEMQLRHFQMHLHLNRSLHSSHSSVFDMKVKYDCVSSDHLPLCFTISAKLLPSSESPTQKQIQPPCPMWNAATPRIFVAIIHKLIGFYLLLMCLMRFYAVLTLIVMMKPITLNGNMEICLI